MEQHGGQSPTRHRVAARHGSHTNSAQQHHHSGHHHHSTNHGSHQTTARRPHAPTASQGQDKPAFWYGGPVCCAEGPERAVEPGKVPIVHPISRPSTERGPQEHMTLEQVSEQVHELAEMHHQQYSEICSRLDQLTNLVSVLAHAAGGSQQHHLNHTRPDEASRPQIASPVSVWPVEDAQPEPETKEPEPMQVAPPVQDVVATAAQPPPQKKSTRHNHYLHQAYLHLRGFHDDGEVAPTKFTLSSSLEFHSFVVQLVRSPHYDLFFGCLIVLNAGVMAWSQELKGKAMGSRFGATMDGHDWDDWENVFNVIGQCFGVAFLIELAGRVYVDRHQFFMVPLNWLDFLLVGISIADFFGGPDTNVPNVAPARILRLVKLIKVLRVVRVAKAFHHLRVLVNTVLISFGSLFWSMVLLFTTMTVFGILMPQLLEGFIEDPTNDIDVRMEVWDNFGTFAKAFMTMFEITMSPGGWNRTGRILIRTVSGSYAIFFVAYNFIVSFAMIRIITAVFLKDTLNVAASDQEAVMREQMKQNEKLVARCKDAFMRADTDGTGELSLEELQTVSETQEFQAWMRANELESHEISGIFHLLDDGNDGVLTFDEFFQGVMRLRGGARQVDMISLMSETKRVMDSMQELRDSFSKTFNPDVVAGLRAVTARSR
mmetsp:Transcript_56596/g.150921  ORF Transcript_56596/g.150921 Transcript_56596/m.150921 type:complete len:657 (-) Transcript_56596:391-2361(-)